MASVVGVDLSTRALDLVKLDESSNRAEWVRCELEGKNAWERTLKVRRAIVSGVPSRGHGKGMRYRVESSWWDDVYLVAIEAPYGHGSDLLNRVVGAVAASLPARLRVPERCWIVRPDEWKRGLGFSGKPGYKDVGLLSDAEFWNDDQNARDAYCLALWARDENAKGVAA